MPGTVRSASVSDVAPVCAITSAGTTVTDFGVSSRGAVNLSDAERCGIWNSLFAARPVTVTSGIFWSPCVATGAAASFVSACSARGSASVAMAASVAGVCLRLLMYDMSILIVALTVKCE